MPALTEAASVLLARGPGSAEVFAVRRSAVLRFFGGFHAFPGGKVHPDDAATAARFPTGDGSTSPLDVRRVAAVRELFEEAGVLLARRPDGSFPPMSADLVRLRRELTASRLAFADLLRQRDLTLRAADLLPVGSLVTPPFTPIRYDTTFFVAELPPEQEPAVWPGELDDGQWTTAADLLGRWTRGECLVSPPTVSLLEAVRDRPLAELPRRMAPLLRTLDEGAIHPIFWAPDVQMVPLATRGLPPSTHTNAYLVGSGPAYLLDPGPTDAAEQQRLFTLLDARRAEGRPLAAIVLTHQHPDHLGAAAATARRYGVPVWAHATTAAAVGDAIPVARTIDDGDRLDLGAAPDGSGPWYLQALHTPGHAAGHLAFYEPHYRLLLAGDMISTLSSVVIAPPDGDLAVYLDSLRRLQALDVRLLLPSHGSVSAQPRQTLAEALAHRAKREEQLLAALGPQPRTVAELVPELYRGLPDNLTRLAELQTLAGLRKLQREGRAEEAGAGWRRSGATR